MSSTRLVLACLMVTACSGALEASDGERPAGDQETLGQGTDGASQAGQDDSNSADDVADPGSADDLAAGEVGSGSLSGAGGVDDDPAVSTDGSGTPAGQCETGALTVGRESLRINDWQFETTLRELFPFALTVEPRLDSTVVGDNLFSTYPGANEVLASHTRDLVQLSEDLALEAAGHLDEMLPCDLGQTSEDECAAAFVRNFGEKAFRRPLSPDETQHFDDLYQELRSGADALDFDLAIGGLVQAIVLSPETLYLLERGEPTADADVLVLSNYEIASRLSYLLWNAPPDDVLLARAAAGELQESSVLRQEAERLLDDPRAEEAVGRFVGEWFGVSDKTFTDHAPEPLATAWSEEVRRFVSHVVSSGGALSELLDGTQTLVNQPLAEHYGLAPNPSSGEDDWQLVTLPAERAAGLLTTAQFAAATSHNNATSIIHRGKAVRERLLCGQLAPPDPAFLDVELELPSDPTVRDRMDARLGQATCGGCHALMDPIGIGMEDLDENGLFRSVYADGKPVDAEGQILGTDLEPDFNGVVELASALAHSELFQTCAAEQWLRYAIGRRDLGEQHECIVQDLSTRAAGGDASIAELLLGVVESESFIYRRAEEIR